MGSIMERAVDMYTSYVSRVSKTFSIVNYNVSEGWCICGRYSNFLYFSLKVVMQHWNCFNFDISAVYLPVRLFICPVSSCNRKCFLLI